MPSAKETADNAEKPIGLFGKAGSPGDRTAELLNTLTGTIRILEAARGESGGRDPEIAIISRFAGRIGRFRPLAA